MTEPGTNGINNGAVAEALQEEATVGYRPVLPLESMWPAGMDFPQITLRRDIEFMQYHPTVINALEYYRSGIAGAEFWGGPDDSDPNNEMGKPISPDPRISQFVLNHVERFWQRGVPLLQDGGYTYGWAPGEHIYKEAMGMLVWSHLKAFHPNDGYILTCNHKSVGIRVKNIRDDLFPQGGGGIRQKRVSGTIDLWLASESIPAKGAWYTHRPRYGTLYGRSQLGGAWRPWRRLAWRDGFEQVVDAAVYRAGYRGPVVYHPREDSQTAQSGIPATRTDGAGNPRRSARDVARQVVEWAKAGAGFTLSSEQYPQAQGGGKKWEIDWPDHVMDVRPLIEACRYLEDQIMLGIGVPPELVKAGGTGSGYSGRSIPREAFLDGQQRVADAMLQMFVEQVLRPLVLWNFGDVPFNVQAKPLLQSQAQDKQGMGADNGQESPDNFKRSQAAKDAWEKRKGGKNPSDNPGPPQPSALSLDPTARDRVLGIVRRVLQRRAA